ncbi:CDGSH iron-sulfur domain-containing protein [Haloarchaeobius sp. DT45]|uniref:CDGSH iron-sulfur domain-containing protein n=1 Tax=Haloarchaeobius sp. DT45 TaxID=3446116 RepID=UPI003F6C3360
MAREVTHTEDRPYKLTPEDIHDEKGDVAICQCGLSANRPFCDGSHRATHDEEDDVRYKYENDDDERNRREIDRIVFRD